MKPLLSLCIPTRGKAKWLKYNLQIALAQAQQLQNQVEIVVSDNASDDETPDILAELHKKFPEILRYERRPLGVSIFENFQKAIQLSQGEYAWVIGNDDYLKTGTLRKVISILKKHPQLDYIHIGCTFFVPGPTPTQTPWLQEEIKKLIKTPTERLLDSVRDVVALDASCFTPIYCSIVRRKYWVESCNSAIGLKDFGSTVAVVPHAVYVIDHLLDKPAYYIFDGFVLASRDITWPEHMRIYLFEYMPNLFRRLEAQGIARSVLDAHRRTLFDSNHHALAQLLLDRDSRFHFWCFIRDNAHLASFWILLAKAYAWYIIRILHTDRWLTPVLRKCIPQTLYNRCKRLLLS